MQLTTKGRYAVTAMLDLASNETTKPVTLDRISERQNIQSLFNCLITNLISNQSNFERRDFCIFMNCFNFFHHYTALAFRSPEWALNVRVEANSPNL